VEKFQVIHDYHPRGPNNSKNNARGDIKDAKMPKDVEKPTTKDKTKSEQSFVESSVVNSGLMKSPIASTDIIVESTSHSPVPESQSTTSQDSSNETGRECGRVARRKTPTDILQVGLSPVKRRKITSRETEQKLTTSNTQQSAETDKGTQLTVNNEVSHTSLVSAGYSV